MGLNWEIFIVVMKTDMVELMLMQNAQMHQIIMHNMMLNALPTGGGASQFTPPALSGQVIVQECCVWDVYCIRWKLQWYWCCSGTWLKSERRRCSSPSSLRFSWTTSSSNWLFVLAPYTSRTRRDLSEISAACDWSSYSAPVKHVRVNNITNIKNNI